MKDLEERLEAMLEPLSALAHTTVGGYVKLEQSFHSSKAFVLVHLDDNDNVLASMDVRGGPVVEGHQLILCTPADTGNEIPLPEVPRVLLGVLAF